MLHLFIKVVIDFNTNSLQMLYYYLGLKKSWNSNLIHHKVLPIEVEKVKSFITLMLVLNFIRGKDYTPYVSLSFKANLMIAQGSKNECMFSK